MKLYELRWGQISVLMSSIWLSKNIILLMYYHNIKQTVSMFYLCWTARLTRHNEFEASNPLL